MNKKIELFVLYSIAGVMLLLLSMVAQADLVQEKYSGMDERCVTTMDLSHIRQTAKQLVSEIDPNAQIDLNFSAVGTSEDRWECTSHHSQVAASCRLGCLFAQSAGCACSTLEDGCACECDPTPSQ